MNIILIYERNSMNECGKLNLASISIRFSLWPASSADFILDSFLAI